MKHETYKRKNTYWCQKRLRHKSRTSVQLLWGQYSQLIKHRRRKIYEELHFRNLFIHLLHKLYDEIHQLMLQHLLGMEVGNKERYVISLFQSEPFPVSHHVSTHLDRFPPQNKKRFCPLGKEPREFVHKNMLYLVCLLDLDTDSNAVYAGFYENPLILVSCHRQWVQEDLW